MLYENSNEPEPESLKPGLSVDEITVKAGDNYDIITTNHRSNVAVEAFPVKSGNKVTFQIGKPLPISVNEVLWTIHANGWTGTFKINFMYDGESMISSKDNKAVLTVHILENDDEQ